MHSLLKKEKHQKEEVLSISESFLDAFKEKLNSLNVNDCSNKEDLLQDFCAKSWISFWWTKVYEQWILPTNRSLAMVQDVVVQQQFQETFDIFLVS